METTKTENITTEIFDNMRKWKFESLCKKTCQANYYKNRILEYCIRHNASIPCINTMYAEMLQTYSKHFSKNHFDIYHANEYVPYLNIYCDDQMLYFIWNLFYELRIRIQQYFADTLLLCNFQGRFKSSRSFEVKKRSKILDEIVLNLLEKDFPSQLKLYQNQIQKTNPQDEKGTYVFSSEDFETIYKIFEKRQSQEPLSTNDSIGYRIVVENYSHYTNESLLIDVVYDIFDLCREFFFEHGYTIFRKKDYISNPKANGYRSLHFVVLINNVPIEVQLRTNQMHKTAELGTANYYQIYKNTTLQNYMKNFFYNISKDMDQVFTHKDIGLLECIPLPKQSIHITPLAKIPRTPADLHDFPNLDLLQQIYEESPKIC